MHISNFLLNLLPTKYPTFQTLFFILSMIVILMVFQLRGKYIFNLKKIFRIKKTRTFSNLLKFFILIVFTYFLYEHFNNNIIFNAFTVSSKDSHASFSSYMPVIITLTGFLLGILTFYKNSLNNNKNVQMQRIYKLLDMLNAELKEKNHTITEDILKEMIHLLATQKHNEPVLQFVLLNTRIKKNHIFLLLNYHKFVWKLKRFYKKNPNKHDKKVENFINVINIFDDIQGSHTKGIPTRNQEQYARILITHIVRNNDKYSYLKEEISKKRFIIDKSIYNILDEIGYTKYFSKFLPKRAEKNKIWKYDVKYQYIESFNVINTFTNRLSDDSLSNVCRYVHKIIKTINHMPITVDEKYSLYGLIRSALDSKTLLAIFLNATFSFKGAGLARQLIGTSFFGDKSDIIQSYSQHINLNYLNSTSTKGLSKRILSQYYANYTYPGNVKIRLVFLKIMRSAQKET